VIKIIDWVIKIGGSLFPESAISLINELEGTNTLLVIGGGDFANLIRKYDMEIGFSNDVTHETAINSMDILAKLLNDKFNFTKLAKTINQAVKISNDGQIPILLCSELLLIEDPFEHTWDVTSDSIAAYISHLINAKLLIATNVNGIYTRQPTLEGSKFIKEIDVKKLLTFEESSIDLMLPSTLIRFESDCYIVNGNFPKRVLSIITNQGNFNAFPYTYIKGDKKWKK